MGCCVRGTCAHEGSGRGTRVTSAPSTTASWSDRHFRRGSPHEEDCCCTSLYCLRQRSVTGANVDSKAIDKSSGGSVRTVVDEVSTYTGCPNQRSGCGDIEAIHLRLPVPRHQLPFYQAMPDSPSQAAAFPAVQEVRAHAQARNIARRVPLTFDAPT